MDIYTQLFAGSLICITPIDHEKDAEIESRWTQDSEYLRLVTRDPARPLTPDQVKKKYEAIDKEIEEEKNLFHFAIRSLPCEPADPGRLVGFVRIYDIEWNHGAGKVALGIGDRADRGCGYGSEALRLLLRYSFTELNLFRLTALIPEYNLAAMRLFEKMGFVEEVRRREAVNRDGRRWDLLHYGLLGEDCWAQHMGATPFTAK